MNLIPSLQELFGDVPYPQCFICKENYNCSNRKVFRCKTCSINVIPHKGELEAIEIRLALLALNKKYIALFKRMVLHSYDTKGTYYKLTLTK